MKISTFPLKNHYLNFGIEALWGVNSFNINDSEALMVISLSHWSLIDVVSSKWIENLVYEKIVIISHHQFLPLAGYYKRKNNNIIAIFEESESLKLMDVLCLGWSIEQPKNRFEMSCLTEGEFISLRYALNGVSIQEQARSMGVCTKTVFSYRDKIVKKLKVRKLAHLFCNTSRSSDFGNVEQDA